MRAILTGRPYPQGLYTALIGRIRADAEERVNYVRAAVLKASLLRRMRAGWRLVQGDDGFTDQEVTITVSLDPNNKNPGLFVGATFRCFRKSPGRCEPGAKRHDS